MQHTCPVPRRWLVDSQMQCYILQMRGCCAGKTRKEVVLLRAEPVSDQALTAALHPCCVGGAPCYRVHSVRGASQQGNLPFTCSSMRAP